MQEPISSLRDTGLYTACGEYPLGLLADLYALTMAEGYWKSDLTSMEACFTAFFRENPYEGGFTVVCGTGRIASLVERFWYAPDDIAYLAGLQAPGGGPLFSRAFLDWLTDWRPQLTIDAMREGDLAFPREPVVRVRGPIIDCQLIEAALLNIVNFETLVATKAARVCLAADGRPISEFGLRRAQGPDGAISAARAAYVGGCASTSNMYASNLFDIAASGTHAHSWVMAFPDELTAFRAYAAASPANCTLLVDTYNVYEGIKHAIIVGKEMEAAGRRLAGIRIDSGDLCALSRYARAQLDEAGLTYVKVIVSNDLDEHLIQSLLTQGACIDAFGVGTKLVTCFDQPALSGVYKLSAKRMPGEPWEPVLKVSEQVYKRTIPGVQDLRRCIGPDGIPIADMICDISFQSDDVPVIVDVNDPLLTCSLEACTFEQMLQPILVDGQKVAPSESLEEAHNRTQRNLAKLNPACKRFLNPQVYPVGIEQSLSDLRQDMITNARKAQSKGTWR